MKNNKKGFTLVELMAVIVILAVLISIAVPSAIAVSHRIKIKMYNTKVDMIASAAELYGQDNPNSVNDNETSCTTYVSVSDMINDGKLKKDKGNNVINPINDKSLNDYRVCLYKKYNRVYVKLDNCSKWNENDVLNADLKKKYGCS